MKRVAGLVMCVVMTLVGTFACSDDGVQRPRDRDRDNESGRSGSGGSSAVTGGSNFGGFAGTTVGSGGSGFAGTGVGGTGFAGNGVGGTVVATGGTGFAGTGVGGTVATGGTGFAGTGVGGADATGGTGVGGTGTGGSNGTIPPGYWSYGDWGGCAWTGVGTAGQSSITPMDFVAKPPADAYCVSGTVGAEPEYQSVALLGFNTGEPPPSSCAYKPVDVNADGPPGVQKLADGIAVNFVKRGTNTAFTLRVQLQGPNGHKEGAIGEADRWCATITEVQGKVFVPYSSFTPKCWEMTADLRGTPYSNQPISAVVFLVPGAPTATPYDFCINGFAYGSSAEDAPDGPVQIGDQIGTVGGAGSDDLDFDRAKITVDGEQYIIQNNNWGNPGGSNCILDYVNNGFTVTQCTGSNNPAPAAFPSIYQGNNGNTANGVYSTKTTDSMPILVSNIASINSTFRYSGTSAGGVWNAAYDIWFANSPPTGEYKDGIDGFVMIWLHEPSGAQPIGPGAGASVSIAGQNWIRWEGERGDGPEGYNDAPVVSFVNPSEGDHSRNQSFVNKNILEFIAAAGSNFQSMYLTDIFAGFEIWNGGQGLKVDEFKAVVTPK